MIALSSIFLDAIFGMTVEIRNAVTRPKFGVNRAGGVANFQQRLSRTPMLSNGLLGIAPPLRGDFFRDFDSTA